MGNIKYIKETIIKAIKGLNETTNEQLSNEVAKCNAISNASLTYIKAENLNIRVKELEKRGFKFDK